jgi:Zn-dependent M32 family carboxypeptidase
MVMMPSGSADSRAAQKAALAGVLYEKQTDAEVGELLAKLESADLGSLDAYQKVGG